MLHCSTTGKGGIAITEANPYHSNSSSLVKKYPITYPCSVESLQGAHEIRVAFGHGKYT